jgi:hypothetical protein
LWEVHKVASMRRLLEDVYHPLVSPSAPATSQSRPAEETMMLPVTPADTKVSPDTFV